MLVHSLLTERIIGLAMDVHSALGPGLLESVYESCLAFELQQAGIPFVSQVPIPVNYRGNHLDPSFRADFLIAGNIIVEVKAVERLLPVHDAQALTYLRLSMCQVALLMNFNTTRLKYGLRRFVRSQSPLDVRH